MGLLCTSDQHVAEAATYTTHSKHKTRTSMPSVGFEPAIPAIKRLQTYALERTATGIGLKQKYLAWVIKHYYPNMFNPLKMKINLN
jgi:hypothetical protein